MAEAGWDQVGRLHAALDPAKDPVGMWRTPTTPWRKSAPETSLTIHYAKADYSVLRLRELVAIEEARCAFVDAATDETHYDLRLVVTRIHSRCPCSTWMVLPQNRVTRSPH